LRAPHDALGKRGLEHRAVLPATAPNGLLLVNCTDTQMFRRIVVTVESATRAVGMLLRDI
jgi:hypothetical protein